MTRSDGTAEEGRGPVFSSGDEQQSHIQVRLTSICGWMRLFDKQRMIMIRVGLRGRGRGGRRAGNYRVTGAVSGKCPIAGGPGGINRPGQSICSARIRRPARSSCRFDTAAPQSSSALAHTMLPYSCWGSGGVRVRSSASLSVLPSLSRRADG